MSIKITVVSGNPRPGSRTLRVAEAVAARLEADLGGERTASIEVSAFAGELFAADHAAADAALAELAASDLAVIATPSYKGAYTGLLKSFLDLCQAGALSAVTVVPVVVAGAPAHTLSTDLQLQPVLRELGAALPTASLTLTEGQLGDLDAVVDRWATFGAVDRLVRFTAVPVG